MRYVNCKSFSETRRSIYNPRQKESVFIAFRDVSTAYFFKYGKRPGRLLNFCSSRVVGPYSRLGTTFSK